jgi:hypothetical protein
MLVLRLRHDGEDFSVSKERAAVAARFFGMFLADETGRFAWERIVPLAVAFLNKSAIKFDVAANQEIYLAVVMIPSSVVDTTCSWVAPYHRPDQNKVDQIEFGVATRTQCRNRNRL